MIAGCGMAGSRCIVMKKSILALVALMCAFVAMARDYSQVNDIQYSAKADEYSRQQLKLDVYYPQGVADCPVVLWFHGGGLEAGTKQIPEQLKNQEMVVVGAEYRMLPRVEVGDILDDAAEAVAWTFKHAATYGGSARKIVVSGHSAGGYIAMMLCLDKSWLAKYGVDADSVMLYAPFSGQAITHYNVRKMQGIPPLQPTIDRWAPLYWVRGNCPPLLLTCGDRELELYGRYDENQYLQRMMKLAGHKHTWLYEIGGHGHNDMVPPSFLILKNKMKELLTK